MKFRLTVCFEIFNWSYVCVITLSDEISKQLKKQLQLNEISISKNRFYLIKRNFSKFNEIFDCAMFSNVAQSAQSAQFIIKSLRLQKSTNWTVWLFFIRIRRRNGVGWVGFWNRKSNPLKVWVGRVGLELGLGWVGFFLGLLMVANEKINDFFWS